ncbi:MAG: M28 family peptidase [Bryobacteraceae bacterium]
MKLSTRLAGAVSVLSVVLLAASPARLGTAEISAQRYLEDVRYLASDNLKGRGTGTPELEKAAKYIAQQFHKAGLQPIDGKKYEQAFTVSVNSHLGPLNRLEYSIGSEKHTAKIGQDFTPFNFSGNGKVSGEIVFAGYGITAKEYNYDDYANVNVKDKIVLVLRHEPQEFDANSIFEKKAYTEHSQLFSKAANAKFHGARAILFVNDAATHSGSDDHLEKFGSDVSPANPGLPFLQVRVDVAEKWFAAAGKSMPAIIEQIDKDLQTRSFAFPPNVTASLQTDVRRDIKTVHNVMGYLPGTTSEYVVIGAHYDHLGLGQQFSLAPSLAGTVHPGADDNASGTAGVLTLARWFSAQPKQKRGILFMTYAGEELGLLGSSYYVNHPLLPLDKAVAMINMDMIGRIRNGKVFVGGVGTGTNLKQILEDVMPKYQFQMDASELSGYGSSDHTSFTTKQVPVLFFFSGLHGDYHRPSDTWDKIDGESAVKLLHVVADVTGALESGDERPKYVRVEPKNPHDSGSSSSGGGGGYGPDFGSIPDFAEPPTGVRFADVRAGSPAAKAGLKGGDILIDFDGKKIGNLYDFTYALRAKHPGDEVEVTVLRDGKPTKAKVLLRQRR